MKTIKFLLLTIVSLLLMNCTKQSPELILRNNVADIFMEKMLNNTKGKILKIENDNNLYIIVSSVPDFYNEILMVLTVKVVTMQYTDIITLKDWEIRENDDIHRILKTYLIDGKYILNITYSHEDKLLVCGISLYPLEPTKNDVKYKEI